MTKPYIPASYVLVFGGKLMVKGRAFGRWARSAEVVEVVRRLLDEAADA